MLGNLKYLKNFKKHRNTVFLSRKIFFHKFTKENFNLQFFDEKNKFFMEALKMKQYKNKEKKNFPLNESVKNVEITETFIEKKSFNFDKFGNFLNILKITNRTNYNLVINFFLKFFTYSYLMKFGLELSFILIFLIYFYKTGTLY